MSTALSPECENVWVPTMPDRILRLPTVRERSSLSTASIYRLMTTGGFPRAISLGGTRVGWRESDINAWIAARSEGV